MKTENASRVRSAPSKEMPSNTYTGFFRRCTLTCLAIPCQTHSEPTRSRRARPNTPYTPILSSFPALYIERTARNRFLALFHSKKNETY